MACLHQSIDQGGRYIDEGGEFWFDCITGLSTSY